MIFEGESLSSVFFGVRLIAKHGGCIQLRPKRPNPMKRISTLLVSCCLFLAGQSAPGATSNSNNPAAAAAQRGSATLPGTISNSATGRTLQGARVVIRDTNQETFTDSQGVYRFENLPAGSVVLSVSYTGLTTAEMPVDVQGAGPNRRDIG